VQLILTHHAVSTHVAECIEISRLLLVLASWYLAVLINIDGHVHTSKHICLLATNGALTLPGWRNHASKPVVTLRRSLLLSYALKSSILSPRKWIEYHTSRLLRLLMLLLLEVLLLCELSGESV